MRISSLIRLETRYGNLDIFDNDIGAVSQSLRTYGEWAQNEIDFLGNFLAAGDVALDVGAYIGTHTLAFSRLVGPSGKVIAIEAQPTTFSVLLGNVSINDLSSVDVHNAAAIESTGTMLLCLIDPERLVSFGSASITNTPELSGPDNVQSIATLRLDDLDLDSCALLKIDAEGSEHRVLAGARELMVCNRPVVYAECNSTDSGWLTINVLREAGYRVGLHIVDAFNPNNFNGNATNIFGQAREVAIVGFPSNRADFLTNYVPRACEALVPVEAIDDLVVGLLHKPQYAAEVLEQTKAAASIRHSPFARAFTPALLNAGAGQSRNARPLGERGDGSVRNIAKALMSSAPMPEALEWGGVIDVVALENNCLLRLRGWALITDEPALVHVDTDLDIRSVSITRQSRPDVAENLQDRGLSLSGVDIALDVGEQPLPAKFRLCLWTEDSAYGRRVINTSAVAAKFAVGF